MSQEETENDFTTFKDVNLEEKNKFFYDVNFDLNKNNKKMTQSQFENNINKILKPDINAKKEDYTLDNEYIPRTSDPYKRLLQLKTELIQNHNMIENAINKFNNIPTKNIDIDIGGYSNLFSNAHNSKNKIDAFINYELFDKKNESDSDSESAESEKSENSGSSEKSENSEVSKNSKKSEESEKSKDNSEKEKEKKGNENLMKEKEEKLRKKLEEEIREKREERKQKNSENEERRKKDEENPKEFFRENEELNSLYERYDRLSQNLLSKLKTIENDTSLNIKYKICTNPQSKLDILSSKLVDLDYLVSKIEKTIGNWDMCTQHESICMTINELLSFLVVPDQNKFDKKYESFKSFGNMLEENKLNTEQKNIAFNFLKIKQSFLVLQMKQQFADVVSYIRKRINSIKKIIFTSEQFNSDVKELNELIKKNEVNFGLLKYKYLQTLESFSGMEEIVKSLNNLDILISKKA